MICILYGFPCEMDFSHHESPNPARFDSETIRRQVLRNPSHMKNIQNAFSRILYTLRHFNQAKYNVQSCRS